MTIATDPRRPDLGGNVRGGDSDTFCPEVWQALIDTFSPAAMLDVGCGEGHAVKWFIDHGIPSLGIDGLRDNVLNSVAGNQLIWCDLTVMPYRFPVDLVICIEVVEHIEERYLDNLLTTLCNGQIIAMTHALPGQGGHHHVNMQPAEYWIERICARGYEALDPMPFRALVTGRKNYFSNSGLLFRRCAL
jgi:hypothetical protein